ncbi:MAG: hypothetical protein OHK006_08110 [Thermodesulfovibrionales bacterium]
MIIRNEDVREIVAEIPEGHRHLRTTVVLQDGTEFVFQEATVASITRAYLAVTTHPLRTSVRMAGTRLVSRKDGFADWQLLEP